MFPADVFVDYETGWTIESGNYRLFHEFSGGPAAELASHQIDHPQIRMLGSLCTPDFVVGVGDNQRRFST